MKKHYEEKLWDWLITNFPHKTDARKIFDYMSRLNAHVFAEYINTCHTAYAAELQRKDGGLSDDFAFAIAIAKEIKNRFRVRDIGYTKPRE